MEALKKKHLVTRRKENRQIGGVHFCIEQYQNKIRKGSCYICCVCNRLLHKRSVHTSEKVNIRVKIFSVCRLHLMENSMFLKHLT